MNICIYLYIHVYVYKIDQVELKYLWIWLNFMLIHVAGLPNMVQFWEGKNPKISLINNGKNVHSYKYFGISEVMIFRI